MEHIMPDVALNKLSCSSHSSLVSVAKNALLDDRQEELQLKTLPKEWSRHPYSCHAAQALALLLHLSC